MTEFRAASEAAMRAYLIGPDGHFVKCVELVCDDDEAAKEQAKTSQTGTTSSFGRRPADY